MQDNVYHAGEVEIQEWAGERAVALRNGRVISTQIPRGALGWVPKQQMVVLGSLDRRQRPWASVLLGPKGFANAPDAATVEIDLERAASHPDDPLWQNLARDGTTGALFIELDTRRRLRTNGTSELDSGRLRIAVAEAYPNCPKYIQRRHMISREMSDEATPPAMRNGTRLDAGQQRWIGQADTFFVASLHPERGADASHRGGPRGFVEVVDAHTLRIPDYPGNSMYNTLGNLSVHPYAGLLFLDFERSTTLQLSGRVEVHRDAGRSLAETAGTQRYWTFYLDNWVEAGLPRVFDWETLDASPHNPP